ncbi:protein NPAT [Tachysurus fulvidraco]|uniref:protein NPAT n=1 Tax=Tachysurus fulvidraco TaxID=1234273 RepID=UPI001FED6C98|nr:protein NPAT [Tachysurus fulvidraco]
MLLPSDVARLVLGYLQQEGLSATSRAFILESPNLREYAEHSTEDGIIPACVFSLFGKNLTTILNEYVAAKAKETCQENQIPAVMTSLWKKLDFTLNQIKSMQNSPAVQQIQRLRTHNSIQNMRRQRVLSSPQTPAPMCISVSTPGNCVPRPIPTPQCILGHSTPVCYTSQQTRPSNISLSQSEEAPLEIMVPDHRFTPGPSGPLSPARRKCDSPRRRGGQFGISRGVTVTSMLTVESQSQEVVTENLSQMVIENAREKILNDRSLQEKLAENINKILASDNSPQISKAACNTVTEQEQSIDEILGLQGEIHMTDDAIQDILVQTESDPAFQALFDLFDYGKNKMAEGCETADRSNSAQESDELDHIDSATDTGTGQEDSTSGGETTTRILRSKNVKEAKSKRKPSPPLSTSKSVPEVSPSCAVTKQTAAPKEIAQNKRGSSRSKGIVSRKQTRGTSSSLKGQLINKAQTKSSSDPSVSSSSLSEEGASMEVDEPTSDMSQECSTEESLQQVLQEISQDSTNNKKASVSIEQAEPSPKAGAECDVEKAGRTQLVANECEALGQDVSQQPETNKPLLNTAMQEQVSRSDTTETGSPAPSFFEPLPPVVSGSTSTISSSAVINPSQSETAESDPNKIVALKIIISDEPEQQGNDSALNQAVSSISGDGIPTIFLSPPAKSLSKLLPSTPGTIITPEETAQAVSSLQGAETAGDPVICAQNNLQVAQVRPMAPETGFIQLLPANPTFRGPSSFFVVTDPNSGMDQHSSMMLLPGGAGEGAVCSTPHIVATPPRAQALVSFTPNVAQPFSPASTIIISSPVQPMIQNMAVPMSVIGPNSTGKFTVVPSQMLALPSTKLVNQTAKVVSKPKLLPKENVELGNTGTSVGGSSEVSDSSQGSGQLNSSSGASPSHRRILCFDENTSQTSQNATTSSPVMKESTRTERILPSILGNANTKRRVETIRLPEPSQSTGTKVPEKAAEHQQQKEATKITRIEPGTDQTVISCTSLNNAVQQNSSDLLESKTTEGDLSSFSNAEHSFEPSSQNPKPKSASVTKNTSQEEKCEQITLKTPERLSESNITQDLPNVAANKENELKGGPQELHLGVNPILSTVRSATPVSQGGSLKPTSKTSPLTKQAVEMLQDIQSQSPISTPPRRRGTTDMPLPKTPVPGCLQTDLLDGLRTPLRQRHGREGEGTPKNLAPPATPDLPTCSPASEAGSENSINMAAHTLMILSRAARTGGPLKDSLRQEEAGAAKQSSSKGKKRKHTEPSPTPKKELHLTSSSGSKKKAKKQKKLLDSFPQDLDVDKFLSSLHYDE